MRLVWPSASNPHHLTTLAKLNIQHARLATIASYSAVSGHFGKLLKVVARLRVFGNAVTSIPILPSVGATALEPPCEPEIKSHNSYHEVKLLRVIMSQAFAQSEPVCASTSIRLLFM